jgi:osmotically-inducible protein OsmY
MLSRIGRYAALAVTSLALASGVALADSKSPGQTLDDSALAAKTKAALLESSSGTTLNVEANKGTVLVAGFVDDQKERAAALAAAAKVAGGSKLVRDGIVVVPGGRRVGQTIDDTTTQAALKAALLDKLGQGFKINTDVRRGEALVSGFVNLASTKTKAGEIAAATKGVTKVHNKLFVTP